MRRGSLVALLLAAVVAGAPGARGRGSTGWVMHTARNHAFRISAPASWLDFTRSTPALLCRVRVDPALRPYLDLVRRQKVIKLVLADGAGPTLRRDFATNMTVAQVPAVGSLEVQQRATIEQFKSLQVLVGGIRSTYVRLPAGKAAQLVFRARYRKDAPVLAQVQLILVHGGTTSIVTYSTLQAARSWYRQTFDRSARSLRFRSR